MEKSQEGITLCVLLCYDSEFKNSFGLLSLECIIMRYCRSESVFTFSLFNMLIKVPFTQKKISFVNFSFMSF